MNYYNTELFHSETYLGADYSDGLKHFKYIKRYRNARGKWVYVYASKRAHDLIQNHLYEANEYRRRQRNDNISAEVYDWSRHVFSNHKSVNDPDRGIYKNSVEGSMKAHSDIYRDRENADYHENEAWREINQHSLNRLAKEKVDKGTSIINNLFSKLRKGGK